MFRDEMNEQELALHTALGKWAQEEISVNTTGQTTFIQFPAMYLPLLQDLIEFAAVDATSERPQTQVGRDLRMAIRRSEDSSLSEEDRIGADRVASQYTRFLFGTAFLTILFEGQAEGVVEAALMRGGGEVPSEVRESGLAQARVQAEHAKVKLDDFLAGREHRC